MKTKLNFNIIETTETKSDYSKEEVNGEYPKIDVPSFQSPCGHYSPKENNTLEYVKTHHCEKCATCKVLSGAKITVMPQQDVANLFGKGIDGKHSSSDNFRSSEGFLWHYRTIEAIRLIDGTIINNRECWSRGFASCSTPQHTEKPMFELDLSTFYRQFREPDNSITTIEIIEFDIENHNTLFKYDNRYFINGLNEGNWRSRFIVELVEPVKTINEGFETMKPKFVKKAISNGLKVQRQGELFFIPIPEKTLFPFDEIENIQKRIKESKTVYRGVCTKCGIHTKDDSEEDSYILKDHPSSGYGWRSWSKIKNKKLNAAQKCNDTYPHGENDKFMKVEKRVKIVFSSYPTINLSGASVTRRDFNHTATQIGELNGAVVVRGTIRHTQGDHKPINLGDKWHIVVRNNVKNAFTSGQRSGDVD